MSNLFLKLIDMSLSASWVVLAVLAARLLMRKAPKWMVCALWGLVALRLLCPFSFESMLSLIPELPSPEAAITMEKPLPESVQKITWDDSAIPGDRMTITYFNKQGENEIFEVYLAEDGTTKAVAPQSHSIDWPVIASRVWLTGMAAMLLYAVVSYLRIYKKIQVSMEIGKHIFFCDYIDTPFILGIIKPKIYLPSAMDPEDAAHVLAHEKAHLKRKDHWWKPLGFLLLTLHWFNPLLWIAYILLCRDIELACDEKVVRNMDIAAKKSYSEALLKCSVPRHLILACPLAFGEVGVKQRIRSVLNYKKPSFWIILISVILILVVAVCFLTDPVSKELELPFEQDTNLEFPFEKDLWATELVYSEHGDPMYYAPSDLLATINLSRVAASTIATYNWNGFQEITLTEENFDAHFSQKGSWNGLSAQKLRRQNANAWVLYDMANGTHYNNRHNSYDFFYLLQQKNGELYLTSGTYWNAQRKPGNTYISWIVKLEDAKTDRPLVDGDNPFLYTRTMKWEYFAEPNYQAIVSYGEDGSQTEYEIHRETLTDLLHSIPEDAFSLGEPVQDIEASLHLDLIGSDYMDVTFRYGEGKVDMVFHWNAPWEYADTGDRAWIIQNDDLNAFFHRYSRKYTLPQSMMEPNDPYQWCQDVDMDYMESVRVFVYSTDTLNGSIKLGTNQTKELLSRLKSLSSSDFVSSDFLPSEDSLYAGDGGTIWLNYNLPAYMDFNEGYTAEIDYFDGHAYFSFYDRQNERYQVWEIMDEDFVEYQASLYVLRAPFTLTSESPTGTISVSHDYASISMGEYGFLEYEVVEYVDDQTPFGIRYRPKDVDEGWIFYGFYPDGFTPEPNWEQGSKGQQGLEQPKIFFDYFEVIDGVYHLRAWHYTNLPGDYVLLYENVDSWLDEYQWEIEYPMSWGEISIAKDYLTSDEIMELAYTELGMRYIEADGKSRRLYPSFDFHTGIWTIATEAEDGHEPVTALRMDVYGNIRK